MKVENVKIYGLEESLVAAGYPMRVSNKNFNYEVINLDLAFITDTYEKDKNFTRGCKLGNTPTGSGHGNYLKGIIVQFDLEFSIKAWYDVERYKFLDFVSSMSTMHSITKFDIKKQCNEYVWDETIEKLIKTIDIYNNLEKYKKFVINELSESEYVDTRESLFYEIIYNIPVGFQFIARMTTNYMELRNIYYQRKSHRLPDFKMMCEWIKDLPHFKELCLDK